MYSYFIFGKVPMRKKYKREVLNGQNYTYPTLFKNIIMRRNMPKRERRMQYENRNDKNK